MGDDSEEKWGRWRIDRRVRNVGVRGEMEERERSRGRRERKRGEMEEK